MATKYKMTGCAKFFIFLLFAVPLAYIGASYYNGSDPFAKLKEIELFQKKQNNNSDNNDNASDTKVLKSRSSASLRKELELKNEEIKFLRRKIKKLEDLLESQKKELKRLQSKQ